MKLEQGPDTDVDASSRVVVSPEINERTLMNELGDYDMLDGVERSSSPLDQRSSIQSGSLVISVKQSVGNSRKLTPI